MKSLDGIDLLCSICEGRLESHPRHSSERVGLAPRGMASRMLDQGWWGGWWQRTSWWWLVDWGTNIWDLNFGCRILNGGLIEWLISKWRGIWRWIYIFAQKLLTLDCLSCVAVYDTETGQRDADTVFLLADTFIDWIVKMGMQQELYMIVED